MRVGYRLRAPMPSAYAHGHTGGTAESGQHSASSRPVAANWAAGYDSGMTEVNRDLAHKVWALLDAGKTPGAIQGDEITSERTARRLNEGMEGFRRGRSDTEIASATQWTARTVKEVRRWYQEYLRDKGQTQLAICFEPHIREEDLAVYRSRTGRAKYACCQVHNLGLLPANECQATLRVLHPPSRRHGGNYGLHWGHDDPPSPVPYATPASIPPRGQGRLDVAFSMPPYGSADAAPRFGDLTSGIVVSSTVSADPHGKVQPPSADGSSTERSGCWIANPEAMNTTHPGDQYHLDPGTTWTVEVTVIWENGGPISRRFLIISPHHWEDLSMKPATDAE